MKVSDSMTRDVQLASPEQTLMEVAHAMASGDFGALPVGDRDRLVGMITDRDIVVRGVALGKPPETPVRDVMSHELQYCHADDSLEEVTRKFAASQLRRLPVVDEHMRLVGILALSDVARSEKSAAVGAARTRN
jgi:CBS domain-containing protein